MLITLGNKEILALLKEKYTVAEHIELYIDYNDEGVEGNNQIIAEINFPKDLEDLDDWIKDLPID